MVYLNLLRQNIELHGVALVGYCLMSNHVHLVAIPENGCGLALALKDTHGRYAVYWNTVHRSSGHAWQGRYFSCPLDGAHLWEALRYVELNPVRAGVAIEAEAWMWSSAATHCGTQIGNEILNLEIWRNHWTANAWRQYLAAGEMESNLAAIRQCTHTGRPLGSTEFVQTLEGSMKRRLAPQKGGRPPKPRLDARQSELAFEPE
jgi:putative transposase